MGRIFPTMLQVIHATLIGIHSHPRIKNPGIYLPKLLESDPPTPALIQSWRAYGGYELQEPGLTCSVYPAYTSRQVKGSSPALERKKAVELKPYTLGNRQDGTSNYEATYSIIVELAYQDATFGQTAILSYDQMQPTLSPPDTLPLETPHGLNVGIRDAVDKDDSAFALDGYLNHYQTHYQKLQAQLTPDKFEIQILPAEELLREYMDLIRLVLDDMPTLAPFTIRSSQVTGIDYPTTAWTRRPEDLVFHSAYLIWELTLYPPASWKDIYFVPARQLKFTSQLDTQA